MDLNDSEEEEGTLKVPKCFDISKTDVPEIPDDIMFPDELNKLLREQIRYYMHENGMLKKNLSEFESIHDGFKTRITEMESKLKLYQNDGNGMLSSTQVASTKIVELSKKLREKNAEVEALKTRNSKLQQLIYETQEKSEETETVVKCEEKPVNELEETIKKLEEKLSFTTNKLTEMRNSNMQLRNDLKLSNKWLQLEIGESFDSLQSLASSASGWRGRAQVIIDLQQKNNELREKLKNANDKVSKNSVDVISNKTERKINFLSKENEGLRTYCEELRKKYDASRARCRVLENECTLLKSKYSMVKEQSERDQDIITTLSTQISNNKELKNDVLKEKDSVIIKTQKENDVLTKQIEEYKLNIKKIKEELEKKCMDLENLNNVRSCHKCGKNFHVEEKLSLLEAEREKLLRLTEIQNDRLAAEREAHHKTQSSLRYEKQRAAKAEANAARIELESATSRSGYSAASSKSLDLSLKDQLELAEENIKALKTRLEIEQLERKADLQEFARALQSFEGATECNE